MEKTTKKKKKSKGLKKRIGIIAVGGLSLVLTICLSVGATLAWFAGSSWSSNQLYMGGPVYVEMAGRGAAGGTNSTGEHGSTAAWKGGAGNLDIQAATTRTTGTSIGGYENGTVDGRSGLTAIPQNVLLPGQKFEIYSQARVFSTAYTSSVGTNEEYSTNTGANTANTSKDGVKHITDKGRVTSTTTSVLRARFTINVEFDPTVGFNNFTDANYANNYPKQSKPFNGANAENASGLTWEAALGKPEYKNATVTEGEQPTYPATSRRDAVTNNAPQGESLAPFTSGLTAATGLTNVKAGTQKSIYSWKFVSKSVYENTNITAAEGSSTLTGITSVPEGGFDNKYSYARMGAPFDGSVKTGENGFYGVWILTSNADSSAKVLAESDSFYKARCNSYIDSYVEEYITEYGEKKTRTIGQSLASLENSLNQSFIDLVNDSSDHIIAGDVFGMTSTAGIVDYSDKTANSKWTSGMTNASWLYIDPTIGNDTNTNELSTGAGGWWYLVECNSDTVALNSGDVSANRVYMTRDGAVRSGSGWTGDGVNEIDEPTKDNSAQAATFDSSTGVTTGDYFTRTQSGFSADSQGRLDAKLFEINPLIDLAEALGTNKTNNDITKVVSYAFPFVNGTAALPGDALTNVFANAKITIQISFQALQAFFPYSANIDSMNYTNPLLGTAKALSIRNAIPIYNEAFDYQENVSVGSISGL